MDHGDALRSLLPEYISFTLPEENVQFMKTGYKMKVSESTLAEFACKIRQHCLLQYVNWVYLITKLNWNVKLLAPFFFCVSN